jgi:clan AA aspartic protease
MGYVIVPIEIAHHANRATSIIVRDAMVDTGARRTTVPRAIADELGLEPLGVDEVQTANGVSHVERAVAFIRLNGREDITPVWISDTYPGVLIGVLTLETLNLAVDPPNERLIDSPAYLL